MSFKHMPGVEDCLLCHSSDSPDRLNLMDGTLVQIDEMYRVCGQCHGKVEYEWERNLHGKITGGWKAERVRWICGQCHDPHSPKFKPMEASEGPRLSPYVIRKDHE